LALACDDTQTAVRFLIQVSSSAQQLAEPLTSSLQWWRFHRGLMPQQPQL